MNLEDLDSHISTAPTPLDLLGVLPDGTIKAFYQDLVQSSVFSINVSHYQATRDNNNQIVSLDITGTSSVLGYANIGTEVVFDEQYGELRGMLTLHILQKKLEFPNFSRFSISDVMLSVQVSDALVPVSGSISGTVESLADIRFSVEYPVFQDEWLFTGSFVHPKGLTDLVEFAGGAKLVDSLPTFLKNIVDFKISDVGILYNAQEYKLTNLTLRAINDSVHVEILPSVFLTSVTLTGTIEVPEDLSVVPPVSYSVSGQFQIGDKNKLLENGCFIATATGPDFQFTGGLSEDSTLSVTDFIKYYFTVADNFPEIVITECTFWAYPGLGTYGIKVGITEDWEFCSLGDSKYIALTQTSFAIEKSSSGLTGSISATFTVAGVDITVLASRAVAGAGWDFSGSTGDDQYIPIGTLIEDLANTFGIDKTLPSPIANLKIYNLNVSFSMPSYNFTFHCAAKFPLDGQEADIVVAIALTRDQNGHYSKNLEGQLTFGDLVFDLHFIQNQASTMFVGSYTTVNGPHRLDVKALIGHVSSKLMNFIPGTLEIDLQSAVFVYSASADDSALPVAPIYLFGLNLALGVDLPHLSQLPLVGSLLPADARIDLQSLQVVVASRSLDPPDVAQFAGLIPQGMNLPATGLSQGFNIAAILNFGGTVQPLVLSANAADTASTQAVAPGSQSGVTASDSTKWITLQKAFGPVYFNRVGMQYQDGTLLFLLDATLTLAGLTLSLDGLGFGAALSDFHPTFTLRGLGLQYASGPVAISGSFLGYTKMADGQSIVEYDGGALIKTEALTLSAFGSYTNYGGHPSLFIYAVLDYPLGGPAFFYVTGLTAGFGYNRALNLPPIEQVAQFPLITAAMGQTASAAPANATNTQAMMAQLAQANAVPPSLGTDFFALGVKFTSFKLVDSFALLTVAFGTEVEIGLLGLATLIAPVPEAAKAVPPLAEVQMAIKASFIPAQGFLGLAAQLTSASFILERACHLTGGYAFYAWFAPSPHDGDFVQTLGGYHPRFAPPPHYPVVPRVGVNWQVTPQLTLKGSAYFALTASLLMAGGAYQITWESGNFMAWYSFAADFLVGWKPFHYDASARVDIGASYTFRSKILGTHRISVDVGANMHVWGPEFSGQAHVDLHIISFDIAFGAGAAARPAAIAWTGDDTSFTRSFLPDAGVCSVTITGGLIDTASVTDPQTNAQDTIWLVNPKDFRLVTNSLIPAKAAYRKVADTGGSGAFVALQHPGSTQFGVAPMDLHADDFNTICSIVITRDSTLVSGDFQYTPILKQVPAALWGESMTPVLNGPAFVQNTLAGFAVTPAQPPDPGVTVQVDQAVLAGAPRTVSGAYRWTDQVPDFTPETLDDATRRKTIADDLISAAPIREAILQALGIDPGQVRLNSGLADVFVIAPEIPA